MPLELGRSHQRLPVTHRSTRKPALSLGKVVSRVSNLHHRLEHGVWFYYARGCSDLYYSVGNMLAASNKVDAALQLATMVSNGSTTPEALVSNFLRSGPFSDREGHFKARYRRALKATGMTLESVLKIAANGPFSIVDGKPFASAGFCNATFMGLTGLVSPLDTFIESRREACTGPCAIVELAAAVLLFEFVDPYLVTTGQHLGFDSIQLNLQPQSGYLFFSKPAQFAVEVLDLRAAERNTRDVEQQPGPKLLAHLSGSSPSTTASALENSSTATSACKPACWFACCMACRESPSSLNLCLRMNITASSLMGSRVYPPYPPNATTCLLPHRPSGCKGECRRPAVRIPAVAMCASDCSPGSVGATTEVLEARRFLDALNHGLHSHSSMAPKGKKRHPLTCDAEAAARNDQAVAELQQHFDNNGFIMHVLPCSFERSRFASSGGLRACVQSSLRRSHAAASLLRRDLPNAIYSGGRLGANVGGSRRTAAAERNQMWIEPHVGESVNTDVGYGAGIGWIFHYPPAARRAGAFPHDAWVEELGPSSNDRRNPGLVRGRVQCPAQRSAEDYANGRFEYFHQREKRAPWKEFVYGGTHRHTAARAAWINCYQSEWEDAMREQQRYMRLLAGHQNLSYQKLLSQSSSSEQGRKLSARRGTAAPPGGHHVRPGGHPFGGGGHQEPSIVGTEAEFGSGFCFAYNQVHMSWAPSDIAAIFYVNDTLSPDLVREAAPHGPHRLPSMTKALADDTKLLPRAARGATISAAVARKLQALSQKQAEHAYANALQVQRWLRNPPWMNATSGDDLFAYHRRTEPLPIVQYRISRECFDMQAASQRASSGPQRGHSGPLILDSPAQPPPPEACVSRLHACSTEM